MRTRHAAAAGPGPDAPSVTRMAAKPGRIGSEPLPVGPGALSVNRMAAPNARSAAMNRPGPVVFLLLALLAGAVPAAAHHAFSAEFDADRPLRLVGTVSKTEWINPHSWIHVDVEGEDGEVVTWAIECGAPNALLRRGLNKNSVPVGTELVIDGFGAKNGSNTANARDVTFPDGSRFFVGSSGTGAPYERQRQ